ncbi:MAG: F0F1 ATP synthase subunit B' [Rhodospirillales bacterium]|nr:F0F1 ATP synthase subunit B' [Rhodospirillales bacterium]
MPQLDSNFFSPQLVWLAITFVALYVLMARLALPRIGRVLEQRQKKIDDNLDKAEQLKAEADEDSQAYEEAASGSRDQARAIIQEVSRRVSEESNESQAELAERLAERIKEADQQVLQAKEEALAGIRDQAGSVAQMAVNRLIGIEPTPADVARAVDGAMEERSG